MTMIDFLLYSAKVKVGGILAFHDTSPNIKPFTDYQGIGSKEDPDNYISCRKAVRKLGLLDNPAVYFSLGWDIVFDEYDETFPTGGIIALKITLMKSKLLIVQQFLDVAIFVLDKRLQMIL